MSLDSAQVREWFDAHAGAWDEMHESFYDEGVVDALAQRCGLDGRGHVVDVGTGTGFVAGSLAGRVERVTGTDTSPGMLAQARTNLDGLGIGNVALAEAPADRLPLDDDSAEAAVANMVLHHAPDPAAMLAEMARVVRPGGTVAITDCMSHPHEWMRTEQADLWLGFDRDQLAAWFAGAGLVEFDHAPLGTA